VNEVVSVLGDIAAEAFALVAMVNGEAEPINAMMFCLAVPLSSVMPYLADCAKRLGPGKRASSSVALLVEESVVLPAHMTARDVSMAGTSKEKVLHLSMYAPLAMPAPPLPGRVAASKRSRKASCPARRRRASSRLCRGGHRTRVSQREECCRFLPAV